MGITSTVTGIVKNWWWFIVKGLVFLIAAIAVACNPLEGYVGLSVLFSVVMLVSGISQVAFAISNSGVIPGWGWTLVSGALDLLIGIYLVMFPLVSMATLPLFIGFWLLFRSFYLMGVSFDLRSLHVPGWGGLLAGSILLALLSFGMLCYPVAGALGIITFSVAAFGLGALLNIIFAFQLRKVKTAVDQFIS